MLVLFRKPGQRILIGDDIAVTVLRYDPEHEGVVLGIDAPVAARVDREEIRLRREENPATGRPRGLAGRRTGGIQRPVRHVTCREVGP